MEKKVEKVHYSDAIRHWDIKCIQIQLLRKSRGQGYLVTWLKFTYQLSVNIFKGLL